VPYGFEQLLARLAEIGYLQRVRLMRQPQAHAIVRAIPRQLAQSRVAMAPGPGPWLLVVVRLSSERAI